MKKHIKFFQIFAIFTSFLFAMLLSCNTVNAEYYVQSENKLKDFTVYKGENRVTVSFEYQNGITDITVYICNEGECNTSGAKALTTFRAVDKDGNPDILINASDSKVVHTIPLGTNEMTPGSLRFTSYSEKYTNGKLDTTYDILVEARLCIMRSADHKSCSKWESNKTTFNGPQSFDLNFGLLTPSDEINDTLNEILTHINNILIPVLWIILGVLLIARGIILGIGIVKSSDEPEIRRKKISGLIWLAIGVGLSYVVTIAASVVMSMLGYGGYF